VSLAPEPKVLTRKTWPPNYTQVFAWRQQQKALIMSDPKFLFAALSFYSENPVEFICHWCDTFDPRNAFDGDLPTSLPFVLFERQAIMIEYLVSCLQDQANGLIDKSRDMGATWIAVGLSVWLWRFREGAAIGWGSRKEELVDKLGDPKSIFEKIRQLVRGLPRFFWPRGFDMDSHATYMKLLNPENGSSIVGEAGDNIGRGGRTLIYFKDESAHYVHPETVEAALGDNTNVQIDISTSNGIGTVYDRKKDAGQIWVPGKHPPKSVTRVFILDWSDHPAKTKEWHASREKAARDNGLLHLFRQEVDRDPAAALQGIIIKPEWIRSAVDAHLELKFGDAGGWSGGFDPYDEGGDLHAFSMRKGVVLYHADDWGDGDTGEATRKVIGDTLGKTPICIQYDCCGIGAGVKSEANRLAKEKKLPNGVSFAPWDAGDGPLKPDERVIRGDLNTPLNKDFYANLKAQGWWGLARRFENTHRMRTEKIKFTPDQLISLSSKIPKLEQLKRELSQAVMIKSGDLRLLVDKKPEGAKSPNLADSVVMNFFPVKIPMHIPDSAVLLSGRR
jgi:phage terminase large subunit